MTQQELIDILSYMPQKCVIGQAKALDMYSESNYSTAFENAHHPVLHRRIYETTETVSTTPSYVPASASNASDPFDSPRGEDLLREFRSSKIKDIRPALLDTKPDNKGMGKYLNFSMSQYLLKMNTVLSKTSLNHKDDKCRKAIPPTIVRHPIDGQFDELTLESHLDLHCPQLKSLFDEPVKVSVLRMGGKLKKCMLRFDWDNERFIISRGESKRQYPFDHIRMSSDNPSVLLHLTLNGQVSDLLDFKEQAFCCVYLKTLKHPLLCVFTNDQNREDFNNFLDYVISFYHLAGVSMLNVPLLNDIAETAEDESDPKSPTKTHDNTLGRRVSINSCGSTTADTNDVKDYLLTPFYDSIDELTRTPRITPRDVRADALDAQALSNNLIVEESTTDKCEPIKGESMEMYPVSHFYTRRDAVYELPVVQLYRTLYSYLGLTDAYSRYLEPVNVDVLRVIGSADNEELVFLPHVLRFNQATLDFKLIDLENNETILPVLNVAALCTENVNGAFDAERSYVPENWRYQRAYSDDLWESSDLNSCTSYITEPRLETPADSFLSGSVSPHKLPLNNVECVQHKLIEPHTIHQVLDLVCLQPNRSASDLYGEVGNKSDSCFLMIQFDKDPEYMVKLILLFKDECARDEYGLLMRGTQCLYRNKMAYTAMFKKFNVRDNLFTYNSVQSEEIVNTS